MSASGNLKTARFEIVDFKHISPEQCPCGSSRRAFVDYDGSMSFHQVTIDTVDKPHWHPTDEIYYILSCGDDATMELDGECYPVAPGQAIKIRGNTWHCAHRGSQPMIVLVVVATGHGSPDSKMEFAD